MISSVQSFAYTNELPRMVGTSSVLAKTTTDPVDTPPERAPAAPKDSLGYGAFRTIVGGGAAFSGALVGATIGAVKGAFSGDFVLGETAHRAIRGVSALAGIVACAQAGSVLGPLGVLAGALAGPFVGAVASSAAVGAIEGGGAAVIGAAKGAATGAKRAWQATTRALDTLVHGRYDKPAGVPASATETPAPAPPQPPAA